MKPQTPSKPPGSGIYNRMTLAIYDWYVLGLSNRLIWKCPTSGLLAHYERHVSANHLDVGVGTGYFLDHCPFPVAHPRIGLLDVNGASLEWARRRIERHSPEIHVRDVLQPFDLDGERFDSVGMNYLLHCLPGSMESKGVVFRHLKATLNPRGVIFGATLLSGGVVRSASARRLMQLYNRKGIFHNQEDSLDSLATVLAAYFPESGVEVVGCAALFWGRA